MIYTAEFSGLGIVIALIWYIASTFLNDHKKSKKKVDAKKSNSIFDELLKNLSNNTIEKLNLNDTDNLDDLINDSEIYDIEDQNLSINNDSDENVKKDLHDVIKNKKLVNLSKTFLNRSKNKPANYISNMLKNKKELQKAILLKEVLGKPKALKRNF